MVPVFSTGGVFECDLAHRRSVAVLSMLYNIRCNPMHPLCGALPVPHVPVRFTLMRLLASEPRSIAWLLLSQYRSIAWLSVSLWNDRSDPVFDGVGLAGLKGAMPFYWPSCSLTFCLLLFSLSILSFYGLVFWELTDRVLIALSQPCITNLFQ